MIRLWCTQVMAIVRLEMKKTFLSRRGLWVYLLAFAPLLLFTARSVAIAHHRGQIQRIAREHPIASEDLDALQTGMTRDEVRQKLGEPYGQWSGRFRAARFSAAHRRVGIGKNMADAAVLTPW